MAPMSREIFAYRRIGFLLTTSLLIILTSFVMAIFIMIGADSGLLLLAGVLCVGVVFFYGLAPMVTKHSIDGDNLILTQGLFFRAKIPLISIISVEKLEKGPKRTGAFLSMRKKTIYVTTRSEDLITLKLRKAQRFTMAFGRKADSVVFDCLETEKMLTRLRSWVTPANLSR
jgi:hypothetical protein